MTYQQDRNKKVPNLRVGNDIWILVRCFSCPDAGTNGRENATESVPSGVCAWCGFDINKGDE